MLHIRNHTLMQQSALVMLHTRNSTLTPKNALAMFHIRKSIRIQRGTPPTRKPMKIFGHRKVTMQTRILRSSRISNRTETRPIRKISSTIVRNRRALGMLHIRNHTLMQQSALVMLHTRNSTLTPKNALAMFHIRKSIRIQRGTPPTRKPMKIFGHRKVTMQTRILRSSRISNRTETRPIRKISSTVVRKRRARGMLRTRNNTLTPKNAMAMLPTRRSILAQRNIQLTKSAPLKMLGNRRKVTMQPRILATSRWRVTSNRKEALPIGMMPLAIGKKRRALAMWRTRTDTLTQKTALAMLRIKRSILAWKKIQRTKSARMKMLGNRRREMMQRWILAISRSRSTSNPAEIRNALTTVKIQIIKSTWARRNIRLTWRTLMEVGHRRKIRIWAGILARGNIRPTRRTLMKWEHLSRRVMQPRILVMLRSIWTPTQFGLIRNPSLLTIKQRILTTLWRKRDILVREKSCLPERILMKWERLSRRVMQSRILVMLRRMLTRTKPQLIRETWILVKKWRILVMLQGKRVIPPLRNIHLTIGTLMKLERYQRRMMQPRALEMLRRLWTPKMAQVINLLLATIREMAA